MYNIKPCKSKYNQKTKVATIKYIDNVGLSSHNSSYRSCPKAHPSLSKICRMLKITYSLKVDWARTQ